MVADLFHYGHIEFLRRVSALGDYVLVGINADDVAEVHKRRPMQTMEERIASVAACQYVDQVIPHAPWVFDPTWIEKYGIDLVAHGDPRACVGGGLGLDNEARAGGLASRDFTLVGGAHITSGRVDHFRFNLLRSVGSSGRDVNA